MAAARVFSSPVQHPTELFHNQTDASIIQHGHYRWVITFNAVVQLFWLWLICNFRSFCFVVTDLQARTFAIWTLTAALVRFYAAYNITNKACVCDSFVSTILIIDDLELSYVVHSIYDMALFTYLFAFGHFASEMFIFRTARMNSGILSTFVFASEYCHFPRALLYRLWSSDIDNTLPFFHDASDFSCLDGPPIRLLRARELLMEGFPARPWTLAGDAWLISVTRRYLNGSILACVLSVLG